MKIPAFFPRIFQPWVYQGKRRAKRYFEGWYYKLVDSGGQHIWSVIPGISFSDDPHAFVQLIEGRTGQTDYIRFPREAFAYRTDRLDIRVGENHFTDAGLSLDVNGERFSLEGQVEFRNTRPYPQSLLAPGIMGWYTYVPFMECYHGVVSMDHRLEGSLANGQTVMDFSGGKGYIEKDWGSSMPSDWVWMQCNDFEGDIPVSLMISIARIPWLRSHFPGFLSFVMVGDRVYPFATYNRSRVEKLEILQDRVHLVMVHRRFRLDVTVHRRNTGELRAPRQGEMERTIHESLDAVIDLRLEKRNGELLYRGGGTHAGLEVVGDVSQYHSQG